MKLKALRNSQACKSHKIAAKIVIVDDGSKDGTRDILKKLDGKGCVRVILHKKNQGKGAASIPVPRPSHSIFTTNPSTPKKAVA